MKLKLLITLSSFLICFHLAAQKPFRFKLIGYFQNPDSSIETDTVYLGCDSLGSEGFQVNLDILDTSEKSNQLRFKDDSIQQQFGIPQLLNTSHNIKSFAPEVKWTLGISGHIVALKWDSVALHYQNNTHKLYNMDVNCNGCSLDSWEKNHITFLWHDTKGNKYLYFGDSCDIQDLSNTLLYFSLIFKDLNYSGLHELHKNQVKVSYPNPVNDYLQLKFSQSTQAMVTINTTLGKTISKHFVNNGSLIEIPVADLPASVYYLNIIINNSTSTHKFIKQ